MAPPVEITPTIDALVGTFEEAGIHWYVIGGSQVVPPALAFDLPPDGPLPAPALAAVQNFCRIFRTDDRARQATIQLAMSIGAYYVELGNTRPAAGGFATIQ